ncbi:MAG: hypothetical protein MESAZ_00718 [Saezia sanguinis]
MQHWFGCRNHHFGKMRFAMHGDSCARLLEKVKNVLSFEIISIFLLCTNLLNHAPFKNFDSKQVTISGYGI